MKEKIGQVFVTQYALTQGILVFTDMEIDPRVPTMVTTSGAPYRQVFHKPHWHLTRTEANAQAERMRVKKIASLEKSIAKLEKIRFNQP